MRVEQIVTEKIIEQLKTGVIPWQKPWKVGKDGLPMYACNAISKRPYTGINSLLLNMNNYTCPYYATYKQIQQLGGNVRRGQKSSLIIFYTLVEKEKDGKKEKFPILRYYNVFNLEQCENIEIPEYETVPPIASTDIIAEYKNGPMIKHGSDKACYVPQFDEIHMPLEKDFISHEAYMQTMFHELAHSTGHEKRLNRGLSTEKKSYAYEELIAEITSAMLCQLSGITWNVENTASYIDSWLQALANDYKLIISASSKAHKAMNFMRNTEE
jgi:antirestriction protein ArdC